MTTRAHRRIADHLATVQDLLEQRIGLAAQTGIVDGLAELAEAQRHLVATLGDQAGSTADAEPAEPPELTEAEPQRVETRRTADGVPCVRMPKGAWICPGCEEYTLKVTDGIKSQDYRPLDDKRFCLADHRLQCSKCPWTGTTYEAAELLTQ